MPVKRKAKKYLCFILSLVMVLSMMATFNLPVQAASISQGTNLVANGDMENDVNYWYNMGACTSVTSSVYKHGGNSSLNVSARTAAWQGPGQNLMTNGNEITPVAGNKYHGTAWVMFNGSSDPATVTFKLSLKTNNGTDDTYGNITTVDVSKGVWTKLEGDYTIPADADVSQGVHIYVETGESAAPFISFYIDDVRLALCTTPNKIIALTFDDGPDITLTPKVLDKLEKYGVPATFMQIGQKINDTTKPVEDRIIADGCEIGNHSWSYDSMNNLTTAQIQTSIADTTAAIEQYSGTTPKFFRPPNLSTSQTMFDAIDLTFVSGITANDWDQTTTAEERASAILNQAGDGKIILLHDVQPLPHPTPEALDIIIPTLISQGYEFVTLSELFNRKGVALSPTDDTLYVTVEENTDIITNGDMEDGSTSWYNRGGCAVSASSDYKHGGNNSLKVTGRTSGWMGPAQDLPKSGTTAPVTGKTYTGIAWVMFNGTNDPDKVTFKLSALWNDGESDQYDTVKQLEVSKGTWTKLEGSYKIPEGADPDKGFSLYVETTEDTAPMVDFYVDDVSLSLQKVTAENIVDTNFEDETTDGWTARLNSDIALASGNGGVCLSVYGRESTDDGAQLDVSSALQAGKKYHITAWAMYDSGPDSHNLDVGFQRDFTDADTINATAFSQELQKGTWTKIEGDYLVPAAANMDAIYLYVQTPSDDAENGLFDFYIDDVSIYEISPLTYGSESLYSDFENGQLGGWSSRGSETVAVTDDIYHGGNYCVSVTDRTYNWNGASHSMIGVMNLNNAYHISAYVTFKKTDESQADTQSIDMSMQLTDPTGTSYPGITSVSTKEGKWALIEGDYTMPNNPELSAVSLYFQTASSTDMVDLYVDDIKVVGAGTPNFDPDITDLHSVWDQYFPIGAAIKPDMVDSPIYSAYLKKHYVSLTAEDCMKPESIEPTEGNFTFDDADKIAAFAQENGMLMRGHTLLWHNQIPGWFFTDPEDSTIPATSEKLLERLKTYIETVMDHFKGKIHTYDVVNEVLSDVSGLRGTSENSKWKDIVGDVDQDGIDDDYIIAAFQYAYDKANAIGDDDVKFCINDYSLESSTKKVDAMCGLITRILAKTGIPEDRFVIGMQMHINNYGPSVDQIKSSIDKLTALGVKVQITEMDMSIYKNSSEAKKAATDDILQLQAKRYKDVFNLFKQEAENGKIDTVTFWGIDDGHTWLNNYPVKGRTDPSLLFNSRLEAKPAYTALVDPDSLPIYRQQITASEGTPQIGTETDTIWNAIKPVDVNQVVSGSGGATGTLKTMWDEDYLYVLTQVNDATLNEKDGIEIFLDKNFDKATTYQDDDKHYTLNADNTGDSITHSVYRSETGYVIQAAIPIDDITPAVDTTVGLDIRINDDQQGQGSVDSSVVWNDNSNKIDTDTSGFGNVVLGIPAKLFLANYGTPVIDGTVDSVWNTVTSDETKVWVVGTSGSTAKFKVLWDEDFLYVLADVTDDNRSVRSTNAYEQDSVEFFTDQDNAKSATYDSNDSQIRVNYENYVTYNPSELDGFDSAAETTGTGYRVEAAIPLAAEGAEGNMLGFDLQVNNDANDDGTRDSVCIWSDPSGQTYMNMSGIGNVLFVKQAITSPSPSPTAVPSHSGNSNSGSSNSSVTPAATATATATSSATPTPAVTPAATATSAVSATPTATPKTSVIPSPTAHVGEFKDVEKHWAKNYIEELVSRKIISGYPDNSVKPDNNITRAELAAMIIKALGITPPSEAKLDFKDSKNIPSWAAGYIALAKEKGIIAGYDDKTFKPNQVCTRTEAVIIIMRAFQLGQSDNKLNLADANNIQSWAYKSIAKATELGIINGYEDNTFKPNKSITRAETFTVLFKCLNINE